MQLDPPWEMALQANFGSAAAWREQFAAMAKEHASAAGRVVLAFQPQTGRLVNQWLAGDAEGAVPVIAFESRARDIDAFLDGIDHKQAYERYQHAVHDASEGLACTRGELGATRLFDVRRAGAFEAAKHMIEGAQWRDPAKVDEWAGALPRGEDVVVYCVYGHEVCRATALRLRAAGVHARFLEGGIDEWQKAGRPLQPK